MLILLRRGCSHDVHAVEPDPWKSEELARRDGPLEFVTLHQAGVGVGAEAEDMPRARGFKQDPATLSIQTSINKFTSSRDVGESIKVLQIDRARFLRDLARPGDPVKTEIEGAEIAVRPPVSTPPPSRSSARCSFRRKRSNCRSCVRMSVHHANASRSTGMIGSPSSGHRTPHRRASPVGGWFLTGLRRRT